MNLGCGIDRSGKQGFLLLFVACRTFLSGVTFAGCVVTPLMGRAAPGSVTLRAHTHMTGARLTSTKSDQC